MNVPFTLPRAELDPIFVAEAAHAGLLSLKGHRAVGRNARESLQRHAA